MRTSNSAAMYLSIASYVDPKLTDALLTWEVTAASALEIAKLE